MHLQCVILLNILNVLLPSGSCLSIALQPPPLLLQNIITEISYWKKFPYSGPVTLNYYSLIQRSSLIRCMATCWPLYNWDQIYFQGEDCYCLAPVYVEDDQVSETVTTNSGFWTIYQDLFTCYVKGYTTFSNQGYCLKFYSTLVTYQNAESKCRQDGGHLMSVNTYQDYDNFRSLYTHNQSVYVGGHRTPDGSGFGWITGGTVNESFWIPGEPNGIGTENCLQVPLTGLFNDIACDRLYAFICQILTKERSILANNV